MSNPYGQIQPYQDRLAQLQNNYQQAMPYGQMQMQQPVQQMQQMPMLQGQMVDINATVNATATIQIEKGSTATSY